MPRRATLHTQLSSLLLIPVSWYLLARLCPKPPGLILSQPTDHKSVGGGVGYGGWESSHDGDIGEGPAENSGWGCNIGRRRRWGGVTKITTKITSCQRRERATKYVCHPRISPPRPRDAAITYMLILRTVRQKCRPYHYQVRQGFCTHPIYDVYKSLVQGLPTLWSVPHQ